jgi:hypothetical protein
MDQFNIYRYVICKNIKRRLSRASLFMWFNQKVVALGGLVVSVLATGPKVAGSIPTEGDGK